MLLGLFEQLLEIIFTFFTVKVWPEEDPAPAEPETPPVLAEPETPPVLPDAEAPAEGDVLLDPLGLEPLLDEPIAEPDPLAEEPVILT